MSTSAIQNFLLTESDNRLHYFYSPAKKEKATVIIVHGLNEHAGRYLDTVAYLNSCGYSCYVYDHSGHGKSEGKRSHVDSFSIYMSDLNDMISMVIDQEKGKKIFVLGHSMGGQILLNTLGNYQPHIDGFITSSANIEVAIRIPWIKKMAALHLSKFIPGLYLPNEIDPRLICRDEEVVNKYVSDPLVSKKITLKLASEIIQNQDSIYDLARKLTYPCLMLHGGDDQICAPEGTRKFFGKLKTKDKKLKIYEGHYHEILNEIGKNEVWEDITDWLDKHL